MARILVIDDDDQIRQLLRRVLERAGHLVVEAANGLEGVRAFRQEPADVLLCDLFMPKMDGLAVLQELRQELARTKVVAMSGADYHGVDARPADDPLPITAILYKPFRMAEALRMVEQVLQPPPAIDPKAP